MAKKLSMLTSVVLGVAGGTAAAVFLATESGKKLKTKVSDLVKDYQGNPESVHADLVTKAQDLKDQALGKYSEVKGQFESGELTIDDLVRTGKQKVQDLAKQVKETVAESSPIESEILTEEEVHKVEEVDIVVQEDIEIDL